jgi:hypothetical protein
LKTQYETVLRMVGMDPGIEICRINWSLVANNSSNMLSAISPSRAFAFRPPLRICAPTLVSLRFDGAPSGWQGEQAGVRRASSSPEQFYGLIDERPYIRLEQYNTTLTGQPAGKLIALKSPTRMPIGL